MRMSQPWLEIPYHDYEEHMKEVGQSQVLNELTKNILDKYAPKTLALLGCSTGNGLEHIQKNITQTVYAIDVNPGYLEITKKKFSDKIKNIVTLNLDIEKDKLAIKNVDLFFVGLVLEYVEPKVTIKKIIKPINKNGILFIVIQKSKRTSFVSKSKYKSLEKLSGISNEVNEDDLNKFLRFNNMELIRREEIELTANKSFICLEYMKGK